MVDVVKITQLLNHYFDIGGNIQIDPITGVVDVRDGGVRLLRDNRIEQLPVQFGRVDGLFLCSGNQLTTLEGSPQHVGVLFHCDHNKLTDLKGAPAHVGGSFLCNENQITSLRGAPDHVGGSFQCSGNQLTSLQGAPGHVGGAFDCTRNHLHTLQGIPDHVGTNMFITYQDQLPMLRLTDYDRVIIRDAPEPVQKIMRKYAGKGKTHMLNLALELKQAGYVGNAAW